MATPQSTSGNGPNKITKARSKVVKPILKKLSHSEKNSLDLDRGWDEQRSHGWGGIYESGGASRSARDVSFALGTAPSDGIATAGGGGGGGWNPGGNGNGSSQAGLVGGAGPTRKFQHVRSTSGTSHVSVATSGSVPRGGSFVHPFQQIPRTSTPPLSYANSLASFDNSRDYSPTITENDDDEADSRSHPFSHSHSNSNNSHQLPQSLPHHHPHAANSSQSNLRRPSFASQRTSSFTDVTTPPSLRVNTNRSTPATSSRLAHGRLVTSQSDLQLNLTILDSPASLNGTAIPPSLASPASSLSAAPMSPLRSSLEASAFPRMRSKSEVDTAARAEHIRQARRKFEERERAKEEKFDREQIKKRERRDAKEASRIEKAAAQSRKNSIGAVGGEPVRPSPSRKTTPTTVGTLPAGGAGGAIAGPAKNVDVNGCNGRQATSESNGEKQLTFMSSNYESVEGQSPPQIGPSVEDVRFQRPRRGSSAKRKTQGYWTGFVLWIRTKLFRLAGR